MGVRVEGASREDAPGDNTGKPDLPPYECWEAAESGTGRENTPPKAFRYESYMLNTGNLPQGAKGSGSRQGKPQRNFPNTSGGGG
jgi:hypothetical protein